MGPRGQLIDQNQMINMMRGNTNIQNLTGEDIHESVNLKNENMSQDDQESGHNIQLDLHNDSDLYADCTLDVNIGGLIVRGLLDTGANITACSVSLYQRLSKMNNQKLLPPKVACATTVSGAALAILGVTYVRAKIGKKMYKIRFQVIEGLAQDLVLGIDFLKQHDAIVQLGKNSLLLRPIKLQVSQDTIIPAKCEAIVMVEPSKKVPKGLVGIAQSAKNTVNLGIVGSRILTKMPAPRNAIPYKVLNVTENDVKLFHKACVANFQPLESTARIVCMEKGNFKGNVKMCQLSTSKKEQLRGQPEDQRSRSRPEGQLSRSNQEDKYPAHPKDGIYKPRRKEKYQGHQGGQLTRSGQQEAYPAHHKNGIYSPRNKHSNAIYEEIKGSKNPSIPWMSSQTTPKAQLLHSAATCQPSSGVGLRRNSTRWGDSCAVTCWNDSCAATYSSSTGHRHSSTTGTYSDSCMSTNGSLYNDDYTSAYLHQEDTPTHHHSKKTEEIRTSLQAMDLTDMGLSVTQQDELVTLLSNNFDVYLYDVNRGFQDGLSHNKTRLNSKVTQGHHRIPTNQDTFFNQDGNRHTQTQMDSGTEQEVSLKMLHTHNQEHVKEMVQQVDLTQADLTEEQKQKLYQLLTDNSDILASKPKDLGTATGVQHHIRLKPGTSPIKSRPYRANPKQR